MSFDGIYKIINRDTESFSGNGYEVSYYLDGGKVYYLDGKKHRIGKPASINKLSENECWFINGILHRIAGPALTYGYRYKDFHSKYLTKPPDRYFLDGNEINSKSDYWKLILSKPEYIQNLVKICPICEEYFDSKEECAVHLDQELSLNIEPDLWLLETRVENLAKTQRKPFVKKRMKLIIKGEI